MSRIVVVVFAAILAVMFASCQRARQFPPAPLKPAFDEKKAPEAPPSGQ